MPAYEAFAGLYDALMDDVDYDGWAAYYLKLIEGAGVAPKTLCDCACGTGSMSVRFAERGLRVTGVDLSGDMLRQAQAKARRYGVNAMFVCQDMCALALPRPVDALVCACDGVNYLTDDDRLSAFFARARESLKPGGALAFDISSAYKLKSVLGNNFFGEDRDGDHGAGLLRAGGRRPVPPLRRDPRAKGPRPGAPGRIDAGQRIYIHQDLRRQDLPAAGGRRAADTLRRGAGISYKEHLK